MKKLLLLTGVSWWLSAGICSSHQANPEPAPTIVRPVERIPNITQIIAAQDLHEQRKLAKYKDIYHKVKSLTLFDLAFYKIERNVNAVDLNLVTEEELKWFKFLVDQRYQMNIDACAAILKEERDRAMSVLQAKKERDDALESEPGSHVQLALPVTANLWLTPNP